MQFHEKRSYQNFFPGFDETYIDELDLGVWPNYYQDNLSSSGHGASPRPGGGELDLGVWPNYYQDNLSSSGHGASPRPGGGETVFATPAELWANKADKKHSY